MKSEQANRFDDAAPPLSAILAAGSSPAELSAASRAREHEYLDDAATAIYLKTSARKLKDLRLRGGGPRFVRLGQSVRYRRDWCDACRAKRRLQHFRGDWQAPHLTPVWVSQKHSEGTMPTLSQGMGAVKRLLGLGTMDAGDYRAPVPEDVVASTPMGRPQRSSARPAVPYWRTAEYPPDHHAARLLRYLVSEAEITGDVLFEDVLALYWRMCTDLNWAPRAWNPVGRELRKLLPGAKKTYSWMYDANDGEPRRLRVYRIPTALTPMHMNTTAASAEFTGPAMASAA